MSWTLTVTDLNEYVRRSLAGDPMLRDIQLKGEISNFKRHVSGHWYFSLKDENSRVNCVMFRQSALSVRFEPKDGTRVILRGAPGLYTASGSYQFYAESMTEDGVGELYLRFERLKARLMAEGLFDPARKRPLPLLPRAVGVVTSSTGAVIHDICTVAGRRHPGVPLILRPAKVQGEGAAQDIAAGIQELCALAQIDVIIVGRGGGSLEDLWAFNEEIVARTIAACPVPVVSAVGHETDVTIADFAADVRAATPSAAAEVAVPQREALIKNVNELKNRAEKAVRQRLLACAAALSTLAAQLRLNHPLNRVVDAAARCQAARARLTALAREGLLTRQSRLAAAQGKLTALGPKAALERGYALALHKGRVVSTVEALPGELTLLLRDGRARVKTLSQERGDPFAEKSSDL